MAVARFIQGGESHCREAVLRADDAAQVDAGVRKGLAQQTAKGVLADLADHRAGAAVLLHRCQIIAGRAARLAYQRRISDLIRFLAHKVNQQFTQRNHIGHT